MDLNIYNYLVNEKNNSEAVASTITEKVCRHEDIKNEFLKWLERRNYDFDNPLTISGYTAKDIVKMAPFMDGIGVYTFMVTLREKPDKAKQYIEEGFKIL